MNELPSMIDIDIEKIPEPEIAFLNIMQFIYKLVEGDELEEKCCDRNKKREKINGIYEQAKKLGRDYAEMFIKLIKSKKEKEILNQTNITLCPLTASGELSIYLKERQTKNISLEGEIITSDSHGNINNPTKIADLYNIASLIDSECLRVLLGYIISTDPKNIESITDIVKNEFENQLSMLKIPN